MTGHLTKANLNWDLTALDEVLEMLQKLRESWVEMAHRARRGELEENGEAVDVTPRRHLGSPHV
jgi:flagellin-specific chaperone FliS